MWHTPWPLGQTEKEATFESTYLLLYPGQEKFGVKGLSHMDCQKFKPDLVLAHLDFQMFKHMTDMKQPSHINFPFYDEKGNVFNRKERHGYDEQCF